jgi:serine protease
VSKIAARTRRAGALLGVAGLAALAFTGVAPAASSTAASSINPYSPAYGHPYRHGVLPTIGTWEKMKNYAATHSNAAPLTGPQTLSYGGGVDGIGVQSGHSKVYLVFYGTQWGTSSTDANGNLKFSNDSAGAAGVTQQMFKGIGTNNELWSADLTQWCDGVSSGAMACPNTGASYIPYQSGGVLAGVWYDNTQASPAAASGHQLGQEAVNAAAHFGNTTAASNRYAYYVILSPHGTNPDNYQGAYCAWHDYNGDTALTGGAVSSPYGDIAFSNQPYNIDSGGGCGVGFVNSPGTTDGFTITLGHEWHEMMSDQNPHGGWSNHVSGSSYLGEENSDECAWISPGQPGGIANVSFGSFGTYAEQASWSNDTNSCAISHPIRAHTEVLGCAWEGGPWIANNCGAGDGQIIFSPQGLSGSYSYSWSVSITGTGTGGIVSGCTTTSSTCTLDVEPSTYTKRIISVGLQLTQSGASWTISATASVFSSSGCVRPTVC